MQAMASSSRAIASLLFLIALMSLVITTVVSIRDSLHHGEYLEPKDYIISNGFTFILSECKLEFHDLSYEVLYKTKNTKVGKHCKAGLKEDGSLAINSEKGEVWKSENKPGGKYPYKVTIKEDKPYAAEIKDQKNEVVWSSIDAKN